MSFSFCRCTAIPTCHPAAEHLPGHLPTCITCLPSPTLMRNLISTPSWGESQGSTPGAPRLLLPQAALPAHLCRPRPHRLRRNPPVSEDEWKRILSASIPIFIEGGRNLGLLRLLLSPYGSLAENIFTMPKNSALGLAGEPEEHRCEAASRLRSKDLSMNILKGGHACHLGAMYSRKKLKIRATVHLALSRVVSLFLTFQSDLCRRRCLGCSLSRAASPTSLLGHELDRKNGPNSP